MQSFLLSVLLLLVEVVTFVDDLPKASGIIDSKLVYFPNNTVQDGVKATLELLGSCHYSGKDYSKDDLKKVQEGNHIRLVFTNPRTVTVMNENVQVSELIVTLPLSTGVVWVRSGEKVLRFAKYEIQKVQPFIEWLKSAKAPK